VRGLDSGFPATGLGYGGCVLIQTDLTPKNALSTYLNDHLTGATAGVDLFRRVADSHGDADVRAAVGRMCAQVEEDRESLLAIMRRLEVHPSIARVVLGHVAERLGRLKPNGTLIRRSKLTDLVELEALALGVRGKLACWHLLREIVDHDVVGFDTLDDLTERAEAQLGELERLRRQVGLAVLADH
jgi:hypothetical protein